MQCFFCDIFWIFFLRGISPQTKPPCRTPVPHKTCRWTFLCLIYAWNRCFQNKNSWPIPKKPCRFLLTLFQMGDSWQLNLLVCLWGENCEHHHELTHNWLLKLFPLTSFWWLLNIGDQSPNPTKSYIDKLVLGLKENKSTSKHTSPNTNIHDKIVFNGLSLVDMVQKHGSNIGRGHVLF